MILQIGRKRRDKGFIFLESIVAASILSIALTVLIRTFFNSFLLMEKSEATFNASLLAAARMYELCLFADDGPHSGKTKIADREFFWKDTLEDSDNGLLREVTCMVQTSGGAPAGLRVITYTL